MVNLEGAGIKRPPPVAQDAFERVWLVGLNNIKNLGKPTYLIFNFNFFNKNFNNFSIQEPIIAFNPTSILI